MLTNQPAFGQPIVPNLNVRHLCPNCRSDPPNIIEEYSKGDLVRLTFVLLVLILTARCVVIAELYWETGLSIREVNVSDFHLMLAGNADVQGGYACQQAHRLC